MQIFKTIFKIMLLLALTGQVFAQNKVGNQLSNKQIKAWYKTSVWTVGFQAKAYKGLNKNEFATQNLRNPAAWQAAYKFLTENDLLNMPTGRYDLLIDGTYAKVSDYDTKDEDVSKLVFEAHRKFIDLQYVISGEENMRLSAAKHTAKIVKQYSENKDIELLSMKNSKCFVANPNVYFVFFPSDIHKTNLKLNNNTAVRKVVIKIPYI